MQTGAARLERLREGEDESADGMTRLGPRPGEQTLRPGRTRPSLTDADNGREEKGGWLGENVKNAARKSDVKQKKTRSLYLGINQL